jgi:phytoene synthase
MSSVVVRVNYDAKSLVGISTIGRREKSVKGYCPRIRFGSGGAVAAEPSRSSEERVYEVVLKQASLVREVKRGVNIEFDLEKTIEGDFSNGDVLNSAYDRCGEVCAEYAKTFYLGILLSHRFLFKSTFIVS